VAVLTAYLGIDHPNHEPVQLLFGGHEPGSAGRILVQILEKKVDAFKKAADNKYKTSGYYLCVSRCDYIKPMSTYIQYCRTHF
jgi:hypothetical protein